MRRLALVLVAAGIAGALWALWASDSGATDPQVLGGAVSVGAAVGIILRRHRPPARRLRIAEAST